MREGGVEPDGGPIRLLTMPRLLGYAFNPLSIFSAIAARGEVAAILWEVDNTFGERHGYLLPVERRSKAAKSARAATRRSTSRRSWTWISPTSSASAAGGDLFSLVIEVCDAEGRC